MQKFRTLFSYLLFAIVPLFFLYAVGLVIAYAVTANSVEPQTIIASVQTVAPDADAVTPDVDAAVSDMPAAPPAPVAVAAEVASAEAGETVFKKCKACHTSEEGGAAKVGPNLWGVFGGAVARREGFNYSEAMQEFAAAGNSWDAATLDRYLTKPKDLVPGTKMSFAGLRKEADRQNVIAYLATLGGAAAPGAQPGETPAGEGAGTEPAGAGEDVAEPTFLDGFHNPPAISAEAQAEIDARIAALAAEVEGIDYERARFHPLHFPPAINSASNGECLVCHQEIMDHKPRAASPAGVPASDTLAWYQTLATYEGDQETFHYRHLESAYAKAVMNLECTFCHKGNDVREESPDMMSGRPAFSASATPEFTNRKMVNPSTTCLRCHGAMPDPENIMGLSAPKWSEARLDFEDEETANGCLICHGEYGFRTNRHNVTYLNARNIEDLATASSDVCSGCHGGRQWYRISYPYPRHPWPDMDEETPDWAIGRPTQSDPEYQLAPASGE